MELKINSAIGSMDEQIDIEKERKGSDDRFQPEIFDRCAESH